MLASEFLRLTGATFFTGVPDSQLKPLCDEIYLRYQQQPKHHIIAANEGNACGIAAGHYLGTGDVPLVYLQNSGLGHIINPAASLLHPLVYGIPVLFVIGWRGQPGVHDEPQHLFQGQVTLRLLEDMDIANFVLTKQTTSDTVSQVMDDFRERFRRGLSCAFVVSKGALESSGKPDYTHPGSMTREEALEIITSYTGNAPIVSTTGKASRELFEIRERRHETHAHDFLTVGSMGHASSIALGLALTHPEKRVFCIDGDGALLMHMGAMVTLAHVHPDRFVLVLINNGSHDTVGGMPTAIESVQVPQLARNLKFDHVLSCSDPQSLHQAMQELCAAEGLCLLEIHCAGGARSDLGRPTVSPQENMHAFMAALETP